MHNSITSSTSYTVGEKLIAQRNYMGLIMSGEEYEIVLEEDNLGDLMWYLAYKGKKISSWGFKKFELDIQFQRIPAVGR